LINQEREALRARSGFTLLEVLLAVGILAIVVSIIYTTFSGVITTMGASRVMSEELRLRQFLERSFQVNFSSVYLDRGDGQPGYEFIGISEDSRGGPADAIRFVSASSLMGGLSLPGDLKEVRYEVLGAEGLANDFSLRDETAGDVEGPQLQATETPLTIAKLALAAGDPAATQLGQTAESAVRQSARASTPAVDIDYDAPTWTVPIRTFDVQYFDGTQWVEEWDSTAYGRLPWSVQIRVNFARTEAQIEQEEKDRIDPEEDPDFEMVIALPMGVGRIEDARVVADDERARDQRRLDEQQERARDQNRGEPKPGSGNVDSESSSDGANTSVFGISNRRDQ
jgi:prepilin-type N-terminal cleavage/methylation domain-containing protein